MVTSEEILSTDKVYQQLRSMMLAGEFPPGIRLNYRNLAAAMDVSATPVREAVVRLASEGFVKLVPYAGAVVQTLHCDELAHLYGVREAIEAHATALAAARISSMEIRVLAGFQETMEQLLIKIEQAAGEILVGDSLMEFLQCDFAFHMKIMEASGNPQLTVIGGENAALVRFFSLENAGQSADALREIKESHGNILQAIQYRDAGRARELMIHHLKRDLELSLMHNLTIGRPRQSWSRDLVMMQRAAI